MFERNILFIALDWLRNLIQILNEIAHYGSDTQVIEIANDNDDEHEDDNKNIFIMEISHKLFHDDTLKRACVMTI